jgi:hypothetical protein
MIIPKIVDFFNFILKFFKKLFFSIYNYFFIRVYLGIIFVLNIANWYFAYLINRTFKGDLIILHYNVNFGVDLIGNSNKIFITPLLGLIIVLINVFLLANFLKSGHFKFIAHFLLGAAILVNLFLLASLALIYLINFR